MFFFFSSRRRHTRYWRDWSSDVCSSDLGKQDGKVHVLQEPVVEPPQERNRLEIWRIGAGQQRTPDQQRQRATRTPLEVAGQEATAKVCGVPVARLPGNSWAPTPSTG